jgi:hypothetical protein
MAKIEFNEIKLGDELVVLNTDGTHKYKFRVRDLENEWADLFEVNTKTRYVYCPSLFNDKHFELLKRDEKLAEKLLKEKIYMSNRRRGKVLFYKGRGYVEDTSEKHDSSLSLTFVPNIRDATIFRSDTSLEEIKEIEEELDLRDIKSKVEEIYVERITNIINKNVR